MVDSLAMFFGAKKRVKRSPARKVKSTARKVKSPARAVITVGGRERKLYKSKTGAMYYKTKSGKTYVNSAFVRKHSPKRRRASPKRRRASPKRTRVSPKRTRVSPKRRRASPKRRRASPKRMLKYGYGLGQPSLLNMMGPAGLTLR